MSMALGERLDEGEVASTGTVASNESASARASRVPLVVLIAISAIDQADRYLLSTVFPLVKQEFHLSDAQLGTLSSAFVVIGAAGVVPFGILVDRTVRTRIVAWGIAIWSWAMILTGLARSYVTLFAARMFLGSAESTYGPASFSLVSDYYPVEERGRMLGYYQLGGIAGFVFLPIGGLVAGHWGWRAAFHVYAIPGFLLAVVAYRLREPERGSRDAAHHQLDAAAVGTESAFARLRAREAFAYLLRVGTVRVTLLSMGLTTFFLSGLGIWTTTFLVRYHHMSLVHASAALSLLALGAIVGALLGGYLGDRLVRAGRSAGRLHVAGCAQLAGVVILIPAFATDSTPLMLVLFALGASTLTMPNPALGAVLAEVIHPDLRGRSAAVTSLTNVATAALSPLAFGLLSDLFDLRAAFLLTLPWMGLGGLLLLWRGPRHLPGDRDRMTRQLAGAESL